jgi:hypothetical protein
MQSIFTDEGWANLRYCEFFSHGVIQVREQTIDDGPQTMEKPIVGFVAGCDGTSAKTWALNQQKFQHVNKISQEQRRYQI